MVQSTNKLNEAQTSILRLFSRDMTPEEIGDLKTTLVDFLDKRLQKELDRVMAEKNISPKDIDNLGIKGNRTTYLEETRAMKNQ